jgi:glycosyltransferase involved in cell wall biosynthesis
VASDRALKILAFLEAEAVTGPAANLLQFHRSAAALSARGVGRRAVRVTLAVFQRGCGPPSKSALWAAADAAGVPVHAIPEYCRFDPRTLAAVRRLTAALQPDVVQTHSVKSHLLARLAALAHRYPWIAFHHGYTRPDLKMAIYNQFDRVSLRRADRVVTPARAFVGELEARGVPTPRIAVLHNAVDVEHDVVPFAAAVRERLRESFGVAGGDYAVACVGRLSQEKGHRDLIDALAILRARNLAPAMRVLIAGDGPERNALVAQAARTGVAGAIRWLGYMPSARRLYAAADAAVLPSHSEGSPNALLEAAANRLPIVATAVGGVPEILVHGESGFLVPPHRPEALACALRDLLDDRERASAIGLQAQAVVEARHNPVRRARALIALYEEVADRDAAGVAEGARACAS